MSLATGPYLPGSFLKKAIGRNWRTPTSIKRNSLYFSWSRRWEAGRWKARQRIWPIPDGSGRRAGSATRCACTRRSTTTSVMGAAARWLRWQPWMTRLKLLAWPPWARRIFPRSSLGRTGMQYVCILEIMRIPRENTATAKRILQSPAGL